MICMLMGDAMIVTPADFLLSSFLSRHRKMRTLWRSALK